jgi:glycosyltransferase involved in cell wall biosynthesis
LQASALRPEKNHELFLRVAARVRQSVPEARFLVVGDGARREELESLAGELGLQGAVLFLGTRSDIPELLALLDLMVLTSHMEANPVSILEALACGKPVVAPRVGSIPEAVADGETGLLAAPLSEAELSGHVTELLLNPARAAALGRAGRRHVLERFSLERMVEGYQELIAEIYRAKAK